MALKFRKRWPATARQLEQLERLPVIRPYEDQGACH